jgi:16S rRNA (uracil1498-N3)-methyltransferase
MQFVYVKEAGVSKLNLCAKEFAHIFKVRRVKSQSSLMLRNLQDDKIYTYKIQEIGKKEAFLELENVQLLEIKPEKFLHLGWSIIDPKSVEKSIAMLNEIGVSKITFLYADYSQKHFKIDTQRLERILINSCEQCGRSNLIQLNFLKNVDEFVELYPDCAVIDFSNSLLHSGCEENIFLIGPEGGFSQREKKLFQKCQVYGLSTKMILRSESATIGVSSKMLL